MKKAYREMNEVSALEGTQFNLISTSICHCWRGKAQIIPVCPIYGRWFSLAKRFQVRGTRHGN